MSKGHMHVLTSRVQQLKRLGSQSQLQSQQRSSWPPRMGHCSLHRPLMDLMEWADRPRKPFNMLSSVLRDTNCVLKVMIRLQIIFWHRGCFLIFGTSLLIIDNQIFKGEVCLDKCCRGSKVLKESVIKEKLECVDSNHSEWNPENLQLELGLDSLMVRSSFFYLEKRPKVFISSYSSQ